MPSVDSIMNKSENPEKIGSSTSATSAGVKTKICVYAQVALVCLLIIGVWILVSMPIIFHYLPKSEISSKTGGSTNTSYRDADVCSAPLRYATTSGICLKEIANNLVSSNCTADPEGYLLVMRNEESTVTELIDGFASLGASAECLSKAVPFLCLHLFGLCDESGFSIQPTSNQCKEVRDTTCKEQWMFLEKLDIGLPDCEIFPDESISCLALNDSHSTNATVTTNVFKDLVEKHSSNTTPALLECTGDYYHENGSSYCTRNCYTWVKLGSGKWIISDILAVLLIISSLLASAAILMISCLAPKRMLSFPAIFIVYMLIDFIILDLLVLVGFMDRSKLFCTSRNLIKSLREVTPFCAIFGILVTYTTTQRFLWWLFHTVTLFWDVHSRPLKKSGKNKSLHITCIAVGVLLPLVPIIIIMAGTAVDLRVQNENITSQLRNSLFLSEGLGFGYTRLPTFVCTSTNSEAAFYSVLAVIDIILGCGCTMLIVIFWSVHKLYKSRRVQKSEKTGPQFTFGTAEKKLLIFLCYYVAYAAIFITVFTLEIRTSSHNINNIKKYLFCALGSHHSSNTCNTSDFNSSDITLLFLGVSFILSSLFPFVNLLYAVNIQELKQWKKQSLTMISKHYFHSQ